LKLKKFTRQRKNFKHSRKLLLSRSCNLKTDEQRDELSYILINYSENLRIAYREKEELLDIIHSSEQSNIKIKKFSEWIKRNLESDILQLKHWYVEIKNSLEIPYLPIVLIGLLSELKIIHFQIFLYYYFKKHKNIGAKNFQSLPPQLLTFLPNYLLSN